MIEAVIGKQFPEKDHIEIIIFDWRFYPSPTGTSVDNFNYSLFAAAKRGVKIRAIVNNDSILAQLKKNGAKAKRVYSKKLIHAKMMLIDGKILIIGSHNYTQSAFTMNLEISIIVELENEDNEIIKFFDHVWGI
jgi:phosphatidylserine/phosphatidylglycerophosphate/cardiolipin synthase-like enzyme